MTYSTGLRSAVCMTAMIVGSAAHADVTAAQVWDDWKSQMAVGDGSVTIGAEETSSGTVTVRDLAVNYADDEVSMSIDIGDIFLNEQSDGSVRVTMDDTSPMQMTFEDGTIVNIMISQSNVEMIVSGQPEAMIWDVTADQYKIAFVNAVTGDVTIGGDAVLTANNVVTRYEVDMGELRDTSFSTSIDLIDLLIDFDVPGGAGEYIIAGAKYNGLSMQGTASLPTNFDEMSEQEAIASGMSIAGSFFGESSATVLDMNVDGEQISSSSSSGEGIISGRFDAEGIMFEASASDVTSTSQTPEFPIPLEMSMSRYGLGFEMPLFTSETSPMNLVVELVDLTIGDAMWNLFDPGSVLPRDPATFQLSLKGTVNSLLSLSETGDFAGLGGMNPFEPETLDLETLNIDVAGAQVTGDGSFTFDNSDMQSFAPLPRPEGSAAIQINGLNKLLDNLIAMGLVPAEDVMGPRMMMGMFARSTGDDQMEIGVEVNAAGEVLVNGNRVR